MLENRYYGTVFDLAVTERCRRNKIGKELFRSVEDWFADQGVQRIETRVAVSNETATAFWKKMGFAPYATTVFKNI